MIKVEKLSKQFKTVKKDPGLRGALRSLFSREYNIVKAVDNISFEIKPGEIVGYIGANGAGKSTTIKIISGILIPDSGRVEVNGLVPYENRKQNAYQIGVVFGQRTQLWWDLPLTETFSLLREIYQVEVEDYKKRMAFLEEVLELSAFIKTPVRSLSLGQRMRADLAASLIHNPRLLYLDEPTIGLDVVVKDRIRQAIRQLNREYGTTVILTTHDLNDIEALCTRLLLIDKGRIIYDGTVNELRELYGVYRQLQVELATVEEAGRLDFKKKFKLSAEEWEEELNGNLLTVKFNRDRLKVADIIKYIQSNASIVDMTMQETEIEEVVKRIYQEGKL